MELRTQALDRVQEVLSPALVAELERLASEVLLALETDFQRRLQSAVRDAEDAAESRAAIEPDRTVQGVQEIVRKEVSEQLLAQFTKILEEKDSQRQQGQFELASEQARLEEELQQWRILAGAPQQLDEASSQPEILARFLKLAEPFARALAIYTSKQDGLALWKGRGQYVFPEIISEETRDPECYFKEIAVRGKKLGAVAAAGVYKGDALDFMVAAMERAIEVFALKLRVPASKPARTFQPTDQPSATSPVVPAVNSLVAGAPEAQPKSTGANGELEAEARKLARLLVSEIKLYNEQTLKEGRASTRIYQLLQKEIDRGRESYNSRLQGAADTTHDFYHDELVRILTENEEELLGDSYPGPAVRSARQEASFLDVQ